jgi:hypothetical protein
LQDSDLAAACREAADRLLADDPDLAGPVGGPLRERLAALWGRALPGRAG